MKDGVKHLTIVILSLLTIALSAYILVCKRHLAICNKERLDFSELSTRQSYNDSLSFLELRQENIHINIGQYLIDIKGDSFPIAKMIDEGALFFRYFTESCQSCFNQSLHQLRIWSDMNKISTVVLTNANSPMVLLSLTNSLQMPSANVLMLKNPESDMMNFDKRKLPYFVWINENGMTSMFFLCKPDQPEKTKQYLSIVSEKFIQQY